MGCLKHAWKALDPCSAEDLRMFVKFQTRADNQEKTVLIANAKKKSENKCNI